MQAGRTVFVVLCPGSWSSCKPEALGTVYLGEKGGGESFRGFCEVVLCPFYVLPYSFPLHSACHHFGPLTVAIGHQPPWQSLHQGAHGPTFHNTEISLSHNVHQNHSFWLTHILVLALCCLLCLKLVNGSHASQVGLAALEGAW